jgi:hypothetical protein
VPSGYAAISIFASTRKRCVVASKSAPIMTLASSPRKSRPCLSSIGAPKNRAGAIDVDATQPLNQVVDELLRLAA